MDFVESERRIGVYFSFDIGKFYQVLVYEFAFLSFEERDSFLYRIAHFSGYFPSEIFDRDRGSVRLGYVLSNLVQTFLLGVCKRGGVLGGVLGVFQCGDFFRRELPRYRDGVVNVVSVSCRPVQTGSGGLELAFRTEKFTSLVV